MRILHVAAGNGYGGIERMLVTMASAAHPRLSQGFVVAFAGRLEQELRQAGGIVHRLPSPRASRPLMIWRARRACAALLQESSPDVVIFHGAWPHAMFASVARGLGIQVGFWQHQPVSAPAWPDRWARRVQPDFVLFNSAFTAARPAFPGASSEVIHCPVQEPPAIAESERRERRVALGASDADIVVLMAARMEAWKGHEVLLEAAGALPSRLRVWIAGGAQRSSEAAYQQKLALAIDAHRLGDRVTLLGERDDVPELMRLADVYCQPNLRGEPFGVAIAEAMLAGLPCVVSALGGAGELLDETCAIVTPAGDAAAVAAALRQLSDDPLLRARLGSEARQRAQRMTDPAGRLDELEVFLAGVTA